MLDPGDLRDHAAIGGEDVEELGVGELVLSDELRSERHRWDEEYKRARERAAKDEPHLESVSVGEGAGAGEFERFET